MDLCVSPVRTSFLLSPPRKPHHFTNTTFFTTNKLKPLFILSAFSYQKFVNFALNETQKDTLLVPSSLQRKYSSLTAMDGSTELQMLSFEAPKIRLLRNLSIENEAMKILDFAVFARPEFDVPIFCANFFSTPATNIVVLDLNPLYNVIENKDYKEKYYTRLMHLGLKYAELFPWGGKLTSESFEFFSPIVIWTKFAPSQHAYDDLYSAFVEYYKVWLELINQAVEETTASRIIANCETQHKYLTWRAEKDPGHGILRKLIGETLAKDLVKNFLFHGVDELGSKGFLDYFPQYICDNGTVNQKRSIVGKSYEIRPWNARGEFTGCSEAS